ncbi:MAG: C40 family peptidase [Gammaproteobacteria bacterium]|nr:C40 family peptidase [Gammaproteobacteria bacterium]
MYEPRFRWIAGMLLAAAVAACGQWPERPAALPYGPVQPAKEAEIVRLVRQELGIPYHYGGDTPRGFDCSGLVFYVYRRAGIQVPRTANAQLYASQPLARDALQPGDLVFFEIAGDAQMHVGIYVGNGRFIHAPQSGGVVSYARLDDAYWRTRFVGGGRF